MQKSPPLAPLGTFDWLEGTTVIDLSALLPCPSATHLLARFGARVIKVESPSRPDPARKFGYCPPGEDSACYRAINSNKELVWLDLKDKADRGRLYELIRTADAAIEGFRPDVKKRLGIEAATLLAIQPKLVYCSVSGYRSGGPEALRPGHDINFVARSGILDQTRDAQANPVALGLPVGDQVVAYAAAARIAAALVKAQRTGRGSIIEISIEEALNEVQWPFFAEMSESGEYPGAGESLVTGKYPCYAVYPHPDGGALALGALEEKFWLLFCAAIERRDLEPFAFAVGSERDRVKHEIIAQLARRSFAYWREVFARVECCCDPVRTVKEAVHGV